MPSLQLLPSSFPFRTFFRHRNRCWDQFEIITTDGPPIAAAGCARAAQTPSITRPLNVVFGIRYLESGPAEANHFTAISEAAQNVTIYNSFLPGKTYECSRFLTVMGLEFTAAGQFTSAGSFQ